MTRHGNNVFKRTTQPPLGCTTAATRTSDCSTCPAACATEPNVHGPDATLGASTA